MLEVVYRLCQQKVLWQIRRCRGAPVFEGGCGPSQDALSRTRLPRGSAWMTWPWHLGLVHATQAFSPIQTACSEPGIPKTGSCKRCRREGEDPTDPAACGACLRLASAAKPPRKHPGSPARRRRGGAGRARPRRHRPGGAGRSWAPLPPGSGPGPARRRRQWRCGGGGGLAACWARGSTAGSWPASTRWRSRGGTPAGTPSTRSRRGWVSARPGPGPRSRPPPCRLPGAPRAAQPGPSSAPVPAPGLPLSSVLKAAAARGMEPAAGLPVGILAALRGSGRWRRGTHRLARDTGGREGRVGHGGISWAEPRSPPANLYLH